MAVPKKDFDLVDWSRNFREKIVGHTEEFGLTEAQADAYALLDEQFAQAYAQASGPASKSQYLVALKNTARAALWAGARELYARIQVNTSVSDADKIALGVLVPKTTLTPVPRPSEAPGIRVVSTSGHTVTLRFIDATNPTRRGRPIGTASLNLFTHVGPDAPAGPDGWRYALSTTKVTVDVTLPSSVAPGAMVWFTAFWLNPRGQPGPTAAPIGTNIPGGGVNLRAA